MEGQADFLAEWEAMGGWEKSAEYFDDVMSLDPEAVHRAIVRHLDPDQASMLVYRPRTAPVFDRPAPEVRAQLDAGAAGHAVPPSEAPVRHPLPAPARARVAARAARGRGQRVSRAVRVADPRQAATGRADHPPGSLRAGRRVGGTGRTRGDRYAHDEGVGEGDRAARRGDNRRRIGDSWRHPLEPAWRSDGSGWTFSVPVSRFREAIGLLQDVVQHPRFEESAIETERTIALSQLAQLARRHGPLSRAAGARGRVRQLTRTAAYQLGTEETLRAVTADAVRDWHARSVLSSGAVAAATGDVDEEELAQALADAFTGIAVAAPAAARRRRSGPTLSYSASRAATRRRRRSRSRSRARCVAIRARFTVSLLAGIASGLGGRFFEELREKRSLAYTVRAWGTERVSAGMFMAYIATDPAREDEARAGAAGRVREAARRTGDSGRAGASLALRDRFTRDRAAERLGGAGGDARCLAVRRGTGGARRIRVARHRR